MTEAKDMKNIRPSIADPPVNWYPPDSAARLLKLLRDHGWNEAVKILKETKI